jgi:hypothetical protein
MYNIYIVDYKLYIMVRTHAMLAHVRKVRMQQIMIQAQHVSKQGEMTPTYCTNSLKYLDHEQSTEIGDKTHSAKTIKDLMK